MKVSRSITVIGILAAAIFVVWIVGFYPSLEKLAGGAIEPNAVSEPIPPADMNVPAPTTGTNQPSRPADANQPAEPNRPTGPRGPGRPQESDTTEQGDPNDPLESINLNDVEMKNIIQKIADWTGKVVIPDDQAKALKITIYAPKRLPRSKALSMIYSALLQKGYAADHKEDVIMIKPLAGKKGIGQVPMVPADQPLASLENKEQIVQKIFKMSSYGASDMGQIIAPLVGEYGHVSADENTGSLLVIDSVANLMGIERVITQFDIPEAEKAVTKVFDVLYGDPSEIVQMLNILLGETVGRSSRYYQRNRDSRDPRSSSSRPSSGGSSQQAGSVVITGTDVPVILIPEPRRKWIIAKASADGIKMIEEWIKKLDKEEPVESEYETIQLKYADAREVEMMIEDSFEDLPGIEFLPSVLIESLPQNQQLLVFGRKDLREMVKKMVLEIDIPPGQFQRKDFKLKHADPEEIKTSLEELFSEMSSSGSNRYGGFSSFGGYRGYGSFGRSSNTSSDMVRVIAYPMLKQVTVIASEANMKSIVQQIEEWDKPIDVEACRPRIIELRNSDPVQFAELMNTLFSERTTSRTSILDMLFGSGSGASSIVGPLYGQLTFEDVPGTKKIIVISKVPEAYDVIEKLILDLDREEMGEIPKVITLKYADPEDLCERLNAMFAEAGTSAPIRRTIQGLSDYSMETSGTAEDTSSNANQQGDTYTPPWSGQGARGRIDEEMPISNVIGRIRFIPDPHMKAVLVLSPPEFIDEIEGLITELDHPGRQVMLKAIVLLIDHSKVTSLGVQLATNPLAFGNLEENAIQTLSSLTNVGFTGNPSSTAGSYSSGTAINTGTDIYALIDFLVKNTNAQVLNEQTLWTKDNEEAEFFKGQKVAFFTSATSSATAGNTQNFEHQRVGMTLRARPSITPENHVDMIVQVVMSQLTSLLVNTQPVRTEMDTTTNMIIATGQTLLLGGILTQEDSLVQRKVPLLGDLPLLGGLFRHEELEVSNDELIIFITPYVIEKAGDELPPPAIEAQKKLDAIRGRIEDSVDKMEGKLPKAAKKDGSKDAKGAADEAAVKPE